MYHPSFSDVEYAMRKRKTKREEFLKLMDEIIPWDEWVGIIEPHYPKGHRGRPPLGIEKMLRMYLLQCWFNLSDEAVEDAIYDSYAMRSFLKINFLAEQAPDATTLLKFRHLLEKHNIGKVFFDAITKNLERHGYLMRGGAASLTPRLLPLPVQPGMPKNSAIRKCAKQKRATNIILA